jgi:hypothetical protein
MKVTAEKDFIAGVVYIALAAAFLWFGSAYRMGVAARMGPGYFPVVLSLILGGFGAISVIRSFLTEGEPLGGVAWKQLAIITVALVLFGFLIDKAGLIFGIPALVILSAFASEQSKFDVKALLALAGLTVFCIVVFVKGLGVPMPIFGTWFDGIVPSSWQR